MKEFNFDDQPNDDDEFEPMNQTPFGTTGAGYAEYSNPLPQGPMIGIQLDLIFQKIEQQNKVLNQLSNQINVIRSILDEMIE